MREEDNVSAYEQNNACFQEIYSGADCNQIIINDTHVKSSRGVSTVKAYSKISSLDSEICFRLENKILDDIVGNKYTVKDILKLSKNQEYNLALFTSLLVCDENLLLAEKVKELENEDVESVILIAIARYWSMLYTRYQHRSNSKICVTMYNNLESALKDNSTTQGSRYAGECLKYCEMTYPLPAELCATNLDGEERNILRVLADVAESLQGVEIINSEEVGRRDITYMFYIKKERAKSILKSGNPIKGILRGKTSTFLK